MKTRTIKRWVPEGVSEADVAQWVYPALRRELVIQTKREVGRGARRCTITVAVEIEE